MAGELADLRNWRRVLQSNPFFYKGEFMAKTCVLVADSSRARFFGAEKPRLPLEEFDDMECFEARMHEKDLITDAPGRGFDSSGYGQRTKTPEKTHKEHETIGFAKAVAKKIDADRSRNKYEKLVLMAPPKFLGMLRDHLSSNARKMVVAEVDKNLSRHPVQDIQAHLPFTF